VLKYTEAWRWEGGRSMGEGGSHKETGEHQYC